MLDSMVRKRRIRASHRGVVTIRVEKAKTVMEGEGTPNRGALIRYTAIIQEKLSVLQKLDDEIPYSRKFSRRLIFAIFANQVQSAKILPSKIII